MVKRTAQYEYSEQYANLPPKGGPITQGGSPHCLSPSNGAILLA
jgi:hypothetical protein